MPELLAEGCVGAELPVALEYWHHGSMTSDRCTGYHPCAHLECWRINWVKSGFWVWVWVTGEDAAICGVMVARINHDAVGGRVGGGGGLAR